MQINKFKKIGNNKYKIIFDNTELVLYEDIILKYDLLIKKEVNEKLIDEIINENNYYSAYDKSLSYIESKLRTKKEIIEYLKRLGYVTFDDIQTETLVREGRQTRIAITVHKTADFDKLYKESLEKRKQREEERQKDEKKP